MVCQSIKPNINKVCIANLNKKIKIQFTYSAANNSNATTAFKDIKEVWAMIKTRSTIGASNQFVNNVNTSRAISHDFYIRWDSAIDFEKEMWIEYDNKRFKIDTVENIDEADKFVRLSTLERGVKTIEANQR